MELSSFFNTLLKKIHKKGEISPFLCMYNNSEVFHAGLQSEIHTFTQSIGADAQSIFTLEDNGESIKIAEIKAFIALGDIKARLGVQIFCIENISRMTPGAQNACLKFFEEPGEGNIIILTNPSESGILETILSRVQTLEFRNTPSRRDETTNFYYSLISSYIENNSDELVRYFFGGKYEKEEYIHFLYALVEYIQNTGTFSELLDEIHEDIGGIMKNNLQARYIVDKYIMKLSN